MEVRQSYVARCRWGTELVEFLPVQLAAVELLVGRRRRRLRRRWRCCRRHVLRRVERVLTARQTQCIYLCFSATVCTLKKG